MEILANRGQKVCSRSTHWPCTIEIAWVDLGRSYPGSFKQEILANRGQKGRWGDPIVHDHWGDPIVHGHSESLVRDLSLTTGGGGSNMLGASPPEMLSFQNPY